MLLLAIPMAYNYHNHSIAEAARVEQAAKQRAADDAHKLEQEKAERMAWPMAVAPRRIENANPPTVPVLPAVKYVRGPDGKMHMEGNSLSERLRVMVQQHSVEEIRADLNRLVEAGEITINFQVEDHLSARMDFLPRDMIEWSEQKIEGSGLVPTLRINPNWLAGLDTPEEVVEGQLVIYHEFQHYKDYTNSTGEERRVLEAYFARDSSMPQAEVCRTMWHRESSAYAAECRIANAWGATMFGEFCLHVDAPTWNQAMFHALYRGHDQAMIDMCAHTWAVEAGHPYPEEF